MLAYKLNIQPKCQKSLFLLSMKWTKIEIFIVKMKSLITQTLFSF